MVASDEEGRRVSLGAALLAVVLVAVVEGPSPGAAPARAVVATRTANTRALTAPTRFAGTDLGTGPGLWR